MARNANELFPNLMVLKAPIIMGTIIPGIIAQIKLLL
jgi:hypothetical protein